MAARARRPPVAPDAGRHRAPGAFDIAFFPSGPAGAHQIGNDGEDTARVLMWSEVVVPTATAYPDSGKVAVWTADKAEDLIVERSSGVDYYRGEKP